MEGASSSGYFPCSPLPSGASSATLKIFSMTTFSSSSLLMVASSWGRCWGLLLASLACCPSGQGTGSSCSRRACLECPHLWSTRLNLPELFILLGLVLGHRASLGALRLGRRR